MPMTEESITTPDDARVGLFGGSFNPPHFAHVMVAAWALASGEVDEVWVFPTGGHPFGKPLADWQHRAEMCWRAFACFGDRVSLIDVEREDRVHYSIETLQAIRERCPAGFTFRWIMGSDTLADAPRWRAWEDLMRQAPPLIIPRAGYGEAEAAPFALPNISSTWIREQLAARNHAPTRAALTQLIPTPVLDYIEQHGLYL